MNFIPADTPSIILFCLFAAGMFAAIGLAVAKTGYRPKLFVLAYAGYVFIFSLVAASGLAERYVLPLYPILFLSVFVAATATAFSQLGRRIGAHHSFAALIGFQAFRLPLELILHHWADLGTVPPTMTWSGENWDIASGIVALIALPLANRFLAIAWLAQLVGFALLLNVIRVVALSSPLPFSWTLENPLQLVAHFPYALIGPLFVGPALATHLITFRKLLNSKRIRA